MTRIRRSSHVVLAAVTTAFTCGTLHAQLTWSTNLPGSFVDISATGALVFPVGSTPNTGSVRVTTVGNPLFPAGEIVIAPHGGVSMRGGHATLGPANTGLPSPFAFANDRALLPYWDALDLSQGGVYVEERAGTLYVQWHDVRVAAAPGQATARFQLQVPASGPAFAQFVYADVQLPGVDGGAGATIGFQSDGHGNTVVHSHDQSGAVSNGSVLSLVGSIETVLPAVSLGLGEPNPVAQRLDFDHPFVPSGPIAGNATAFTLVGISNVRLVGSFAALGDALTAGSNVNGQALASRNSVLTIVNVGGLIDDLLAGGGFEFRLQSPATAFGVVFVDQLNWSYRVDLHLGNVHVGSATFVYANPSFPFGGHYWTSRAGEFDRVTITAVNDTGGVGIDNITFANDGATIGAPFCVPAATNSTGVPGQLDATGSSIAALDDVTLVARSLPPSSFGFFLIAPHAGPPITFPGGASWGFLCLGGGIGRFVGPGQIQSTGALGSLSLRIQLAQLPSPIAAAREAFPGDTWHFQAWHRDSNAGVAGSNFTAGLSISFL